MNYWNFKKEELIQLEGQKIIFTPLGIKVFKRALDEGKTYKELSQYVQISNVTFANRCKEYGIAKKISYNLNLGRKKIYSFKEDYFSVIDNYYKAYWLGFIAADGYIDSIRNKLEIGLQGQDKEHLFKFSSMIQSNKPIEINDKVCKNKTYRSCRISLFSKQLIQDLNFYGIYNKKSLILKPPKNVPEQYLNGWIAGYFDGDGCLSIDKNNFLTVGFTGTYEIINFIKDFFTIDNKISSEHKSDITYSIHYSQQTGLKVLKQIYLQSYKDIYLKRKYNKFLLLQSN